MRRNHKQMSPKELTLALKAINKTGRTFEVSGGVTDFVENVLTEGERVIIGRRILIAEMILQGLTYYEIDERLQVSPNTFTKVRKWLSGQIPDYQTIVTEAAQRSKKARHVDKRVRQKIDPFSLEALKKRYPMHFLLLNLMDEFRR